MSLLGLPSSIGRYQVRSLLGRGGMGRVVAGHDPVLHRDVALKLVEPASIEVETLAEVRFLFHREARATAALRHPGIVEIFDYSGPDADLMYIACELVDGPTLRDVLEKRGTVSLRAAAALGYELAGALAHAHGRGIVHRDLKPENVFWTAGGRIVLSDFGIAKAFGGKVQLDNTIHYGATNLYGSPAYMAPEQLGGGPVGPPADLWALGALLYECACGVQAFDGPSLEAIFDAVLHGKRRPLSAVCALPPALERLIERLLAVEPAARPTGAHEVASTLRDVLDELEVSDPRLALRGFGDETVAAARAAGAENGGRELVLAPEAQPARAPQPPPNSSWLARPPLLIGAIALAVAALAAAFLLKRVGAGDGASALLAQTEKSIFVQLRLAPNSLVSVDGRELGIWSEGVRLAIPAGRHVVEARSQAGHVVREIVLLEGTQPSFDLRAP